MRCDRARHGGSVRLRTASATQGVEFFFDRAGEVRVRGLDFGIDHRDRHVFAGGDLLRLFDMQCAQRVLRIVARTGAGLARLVLHGEQVIGLRVRDDDLILQRRHEARHRIAGGDTPAIEGGAPEQREALRIELRQTECTGEPGDRLWRDARLEFDQHLVGHEPAFTGWRNAAGAATAATTDYRLRQHLRYRPGPADQSRVQDRDQHRYRQPDDAEKT